MKTTLWITERDEILFVTLKSIRQSSGNIIFEVQENNETFYLKQAQITEVFRMLQEGLPIRQVSRELE